MKRITSSANPHYKSLLKLARSTRERSKAGLSLLDGPHLVAAYIEHIGAPRQLVVSDSGRNHREVRALLETQPMADVVDLSDAMFQPLSGVEAPTGLLAVVDTPVARAVPSAVAECVLLENVQDPGNVGSILRTAAAAGVRDVLLSKGAADVWSPRVLRAGMGAHFTLRIYEGIDLEDFARGYPGTVIATTQRAQRSIFECKLTGRVALLFGNEGNGVSQLLLSHAPEQVSIPMPGKAESLNVAAAAAICLFERVRQMQRSTQRSASKAR